MSAIRTAPSGDGRFYGLRYREWQSRRQYILARDGYRCLKCGSFSHLSVDHIVPVALGGNSEVWNLQTLCRECNHAKGKQIIDYRTEFYD